MISQWRRPCNKVGSNKCKRNLYQSCHMILLAQELYLIGSLYATIGDTYGREPSVNLPNARIVGVLPLHIGEAWDSDTDGLPHWSPLVHILSAQSCQPNLGECCLFIFSGMSILLSWTHWSCCWSKPSLSWLNAFMTSECRYLAILIYDTVSNAINEHEITFALQNLPPFWCVGTPQPGFRSQQVSPKISVEHFMYITKYISSIGF